MKNIQKVLKATNKALGVRKGKPAMVRLAQLIHMPLGPLCLFTVGDLKRGIMPSVKDLAVVAKAFTKMELEVNGKRTSWWTAQFWPPFITVKELFYKQGTIYLVLLGDIDKNILPSIIDLEKARDQFVPALPYLGASKATNCIFFPPILTAKRTVKGKREGLSLVLGDRKKGIMPNKKDIKACKDLVIEAVKDLSIKPADVVVVSA
jgi:hypothetical protein